MNGVLFVFSSRRRHTIYWRDWSSDVCSSDLAVARAVLGAGWPTLVDAAFLRRAERDRDRKSVVWGKSVDLGGRRILKKKKQAPDGLVQLLQPRTDPIRPWRPWPWTWAWPATWRTAARVRWQSHGGSTCFFFSSRRRHTRYWRDWSSDVCSTDLPRLPSPAPCRGTWSRSTPVRRWRSEERRVGKECRSRWSRYDQKKKLVKAR